MPTSIEVGTAVQQTYAAHPLLQAARAIGAAEAIGTPGRFTLGVGPSHRPAIEGRLGLSYDTPGRAVHDEVAEARAAAAEQFATYGLLPNYQRILAHGGLSGPAEAVIVGDEASVTRQIKALFEAGATDVWLPPFPVGPDRSASRARTRALLKDLVRSKRQPQIASYPRKSCLAPLTK